MYLTVCDSRRQAFALDDATWLIEAFEIRRTKAVPSAGANWDSFSIITNHK